MGNMEGKAALALAQQNATELEDIVKQQSLILNKIPTVNSITVTLSTANASSTIANGINIDAILNAGVSTGTVNPLFKFVPDATKRANTFPDYTAADCLARQGFSTEFNYYGRYLDVRFKGGQEQVRILVDNQYTQDAILPLSPNDGNGYRYIIDFGTVTFRNIKIEANYLTFFGLTIDGNGTIFPPTKVKNKKAIVNGDSFIEGQSSLCCQANSMGAILCKVLGYDFWSMGAGSTGYIAMGSAGKFIDRVQSEVIAKNPDVFFGFGGLNDPLDANAFYTAATLYYDAIKGGLPNAQVYIFSPNYPNGSIPQGIINNVEKLRLVALEHGYPYIDMINGSTYLANGTKITDGTGVWVNGIGNEGTPQITGNATVFTCNDTTHPSVRGHRYLGERCAVEIAKILTS